jgi:hypothetical protein
MSIEFNSLEEILLLGDFNLSNNMLNSIPVTNIIATFDLVKHVSEPIHLSGSKLDPVFTRKMCNPIPTSENKSFVW